MYDKFLETGEIKDGWNLTKSSEIFDFTSL